MPKRTKEESQESIRKGLGERPEPFKLVITDKEEED